MKSPIPIARLATLAAAITAVALLQGCATPATQQAMSIAYGDVAAATQAELKGAFVVRNVTGGKATNPLWTSQVDNASFQQALSQSLAVAGYGAAPGQGGRYQIDADLQQLKQPLFGLTFDVLSTVQYTVEGAGLRRQFPVSATGTATTSDAFVAIERLRIANERSVKENIKEFLRQLPAQLAQ
ncbi:MAG: hypothetical protein RLZZ555_1298 [Pseudomonadota bacterium]|jgi:hypothetical protein